MTFLEGAPLTQAMVLAGQHVVWEWNAWVNAMQIALFQVDPTQEARGWIHGCKLTQDSKFATYTEKFLLNVAILDSNGASMADLDQVAHFKRGLEGSMYDRPTDVDELTKGPFKTLTGIVGKCRAIFQAHGGAEAWKGRQDAQGEGRHQGRRFKVRGPGGAGHGGQGQGAQDNNKGNNKGNGGKGQKKRLRGGPFDAKRPCYNCGQLGHWSKECPNNNDGNNNSNKQQKRQALDPALSATAFLTAVLNPFSEPPFLVSPHPSRKHI